MGKKTSGGGWLKKIPGLGKMQAAQKAAAETGAAPEEVQHVPPGRKLHRNPLMPGGGSGSGARAAAADTGAGDHTQATLSDIILVIDDSEIDRMILEELLTEAGYQVILAVDGEDGVRKCLEHHPALVVTDMIMPGMNGTEVILKIRAQ